MDLYEEANGSLMVTGGFQYLPEDKRLNIIRLYENGSIDPSWYPSIWITEGVGNVQKANDIYYFTYSYLGIARASYSGYFLDNDLVPLDTHFSGGTHLPYIFPNGSIITGGDGGKYPSANNFQRRLYFMRIRPDGYVDSSFHHNTNFDVLETHRYDASRLLLYGNYLAAYDSLPVNKLCLIDTLGNLDTTFHPGCLHGALPVRSISSPMGKSLWGVFLRSKIPRILYASSD
ncbi:MAG: hypothetical protein R3C61_14900 [Bacteroidia bacterium]